MLKCKSNHNLWSSVSKIETCVNNVNAHINRIDNCIELRKVILFGKGAFICANTNWTDFKILIMNELLEVHRIKLVHELFALLFTQWSAKNLWSLALKLLKDFFPMIGVELFGQLYRVRESVSQTQTEPHYFLDVKNLEV